MNLEQAAVAGGAPDAPRARNRHLHIIVKFDDEISSNLTTSNFLRLFYIDTDYRHTVVPHGTNYMVVVVPINSW